jgi:hypothetical protein
LGILHAPGYPAYVLLGHAFGSVVAVGSWAFRVNLFSLVCTTLLVAAVYLFARCFGASLAGSAVGALVLATCASVWFNAGFAKHYALSGLLVTTSALLAMLWIKHGQSLLLVSAGVLLGLAAGAAWELAALMVVGIVVLIAAGPRRPTMKAGVAAGAAVLVVAFGLSVFVLVRARQDPTLNWGDATTVHRFIRLIAQQDFRNPGASAVQGGLLGRIPGNVAILIRDIGLGAFALATVGAVVAYPAIGKARALYLAVVGVLSLLAVTLVAGKAPIGGFYAAIEIGAYLLNTLVVLAVLAALGTTWAIAEIPRLIGGISGHVRRDTATHHPLRLALVVGLALIAVLPSILVHYQYADHRQPPLADRYAADVFALLPPHSALIVWGTEFSWPMLYRQVVDHDRPDVAIISADELPIGWAVDELTHRYHLGDALRPAPVPTMVQRLIDRLRETRPVYLETAAMDALQKVVAYRSEGLVGEVTNGIGPQPATNVAAIAEAIDKSEQAAGVTTLHLRYANRAVNYAYQRAHVELAKQYVLQHEDGPAINEIGRALQLYPDDPAVTHAYAFVRTNEGQQAENMILGL